MMFCWYFILTDSIQHFPDAYSFALTYFEFGGHWMHLKFIQVFM